DVHATIDLQTDITATGVDQRTRFAQLVEGAGDELLPAEAWVDAHQQHHVDLVHHILQGVQAGGRVEHQAGLATTILDQLKRTVDVLRGFRVEGDVGGTRFDKVANDAVNRA